MMNFKKLGFLFEDLSALIHANIDGVTISYTPNHYFAITGIFDIPTHVDQHCTQWKSHYMNGILFEMKWIGSMLVGNP